MCISRGRLGGPFVLIVYFYFVCSNFFFFFFFYVPHSFVQACAVATDEDHRVVLTLGVDAVWLSFLALRCLYGVLDSGQLLPSLVD